MRLSTRMDLHLIPEIFRLFFAVTGEEPWLARRRELDHRRKTEPGVAAILNTVYSRELAISSLIMNRYRDFGYPSAYDRPDILASYSFVATFVRLFQKIPGPSSGRLVARLVGDLQHKDLGALTLELETIAHLSHLGFDLEFHDLTGAAGGSFDFLATKDGLEIEIDCKSISADTGNPITAFGAAAITSFSDHAIKSYREAGQTIVLTIVTKNRISKRDNNSKEISKIIASSLIRRESILSDFSSVNYASYPSSDIFNFEKYSTVQYPLVVGGFEDYDHIIASSDEGAGGVVLLLKSTAKSNRVKKITDTLKESIEKQFTRSRPAVLFVRLADMTGDIFIRYIGQRTFMNDVCDNLFASAGKRSHIAGVVFVPGSPIVAKDVHDGFRVAGEQSVSLFIRNEAHPIVENPIFSMLSPFIRNNNDKV